MMNDRHDRQRIFGVDIDNFDLNEAVDAVAQLAASNSAHSVVTVNLDHVLKLKTDEAFRAAYAASSVCVADGAPFVLLGKIDGTPLKARVAGSDLIEPVCARAAQDGLSVFLLGTTEERLGRAANELVARYPGLTIAGIHAPPMGFDKNEDAQQAAFALLREKRPDIVLVALGAPKQEIFSARAVGELDHGVFLNIGAGLDFIAGDVSRAPRWMQKTGIEWVHRVLSEPSRLGPRYLKIIASLPSMVHAHYQAKKAS